MIRRLVLTLGALLMTPAPAAAWWQYGHETVATIATLSIKPGTRREIDRLLAHSAALETPTCPARTLEEASVWADCVRAMGDRFSYSSPWHYQNVDVCRPFDQEAACRDGNCISAQIERNARLLADRAIPARERLQALLFLTHFLGDLHMPLHAGDRSDRGGNGLRVSYGVITGRNLHSVWDGFLADRGISTPPGEARGILAALGMDGRTAMQAGTVTDWARESWQVSRDFAYGTALADPCGPVPTEQPVIDEQTTQRLIPVIKQQIARGGLRLARMLDEALG